MLKFDAVRSGSAHRAAPLALVLVLAILFFLSFTPSESEGSRLGLLLRVGPFVVIAIVALVLAKGRVKLSTFALIGALALGAYIFVKHIAAPTPFAVLCAVMYASAAVFAGAVNGAERVRGAAAAALAVVIIAWLLALLLQLALYASGIGALPLHEFLFPMSEQRGGQFFGTSRLGGVHNEPGTYANWMFGACLLRALLIRKLHTPLHTVAFLSLPLTLSFWGFVATAIYIAALIAGLKVTLARVAYVLVTVVAAGALLAWNEDLVRPYVEQRLSYEDASAGYKLDVANALIEDPARWILVGENFAENPCDSCLSPQDAGVGLNSLFYFGLPVILLWLFAAFGVWKVLGFSGAMVFLSVAFSKYYFWDPIFAATMAIALCTTFAQQRRKPAAIGDRRSYEIH